MLAGILGVTLFYNQTVCNENQTWFNIIFLCIYILKMFVGTNTVSIELNRHEYMIAGILGETLV